MATNYIVSFRHECQFILDMGYTLKWIQWTFHERTDLWHESL